MGGYQTATAQVVGPPPVDCTRSGSDAPERVSVRLAAGP